MSTSAPQHRNTDEWREVVHDSDTYLVHRYSIITTDIVCEDAWESTVDRPGGHSTIRSGNDVNLPGATRWLGKVTTRRGLGDFDGMPYGSRERIAAVRDFHDELDRLDAAICATPAEDPELIVSGARS